MAPDTIVADVAQNTVWNIRNASIGMLLGKLPSKPMAKRFGMPIKPPSTSVPNIIPKPTNQKRTVPNIKSTKFFIRMLAVFLLLVKPASTSANPGCIKKTSIAASRTQTVSNAFTVVSISLLNFSPLLFVFCVIEGYVTTLPCTYSYCILYWYDKYAAVAYLTCLGSLNNGCNGFLRILVTYHY